MTVTVYRSTDASAPVLTGVAGAMKAVLDACLVNGYGAKAAAGWSAPFSATPTQTTTLAAAITTTSATSCSVASATGFPAAALQGSESYYMIQIDSEQMLVSAGQGTGTWTITRGQNGTTAATHLINATVTYRYPAVYRNGTGSTQLYWQVDDYVGSNSVSTPRCYAEKPSINLYETMSDARTGTNKIGFKGALTLMNKGNSPGDATVRNWVIVADQKTCHLMVQTGETGSVAGGWGYAGFGDIKSYKTGDIWNAFVVARNYNASGLAADWSWYNAYNYDYGTGLSSGYSSFSLATPGHYLVRNYAAAVGVRTCGVHSDDWAVSQNAVSNVLQYMGAVAALPYPYAINSSFVIAPLYWHECDVVNFPIRGYARGFWVPGHNAPAANNDTFSGTGTLAGKTFEVFRHSFSGTFVIETSDTWP